jgi:predicted nucleic acid-binding protein
MTVVADTSFLAAFVNPRDPLHDAAYGAMARIATGEFGMPITSEHVLAEGLALLQRRAGRAGTSRRYVALFLGAEGQAPVVQLRRTSREALGRAVDLHFQHFDLGLSLVDCVLLGMALEAKAPVATFDGGFKGLAPLVPG